MPNFILTEKQLSKISEKITLEYEIKELESKWESLNENEKKFVVSFLTETQPKKKRLVSEDKWYNTLGDVVGIFDPTGVVDLVNGISYLKQGDNLFGFLSIVSAVPYVGDVISKPIMGALKVGAPSAKAIDGILTATKNAKTPEEIAKLSAELAKMSDTGGLTGKFVKGMGTITDKLRGFIERVPSWPAKGIKGTILKWLDLFEGAAKAGKGARTGVADVAKQYGVLASRAKTISSADKALLQAKLSQELKNIKSIPGAVSGFRTPSADFFSWKMAFGGLGQVFTRNRSVRHLMRQTKWWAGFLDWLGLANFVGPEEIEKQIGEDEMNKKVAEYNKTDIAKDLYNQDFPETPQQQDQTDTPSTEPTSTPKKEEGFLKSLLQSVFLGPLKPVANS
jgi:hypothetical protein